MANKFCVFVLTHGRPTNVKTIKTLEKAGYTGDLFLLVDDEDSKAENYKEIYGDKVIIFSKEQISKKFDEGDNFKHRRAIIYARNICHYVALNLGYKHYIQLDDDYEAFAFRFNQNAEYGWFRIKESFNSIIDSMIDFLNCSKQITSVAMSQGGDHIGGGQGQNEIKLKRKAMNSFLCSTDKPFSFFGKINEDVNTYTCAQRRADVLFFTLNMVCLKQTTTQSSAGGMTETYLDSGTYVKSFYSIMYAPSCVKISVIHDHNGGNSMARIHHAVAWNNAAPLILDEKHKKKSINYNESKVN